MTATGSAASSRNLLGYVALAERSRAVYARLLLDEHRCTTRDHHTRSWALLMLDLGFRMRRAYLAPRGVGPLCLMPEADSVVPTAEASLPAPKLSPRGT